MALKAGEGYHRVMSAEEARAIADREDAWAAFEAVLDRVEDLDLSNDLSNAVFMIPNAEIDALHARLCRMLPHLTDVIALACHPAETPAPEYLAAGGAPEPVIWPAQDGRGGRGPSSLSPRRTGGAP